MEIIIIAVLVIALAGTITLVVIQQRRRAITAPPQRPALDPLLSTDAPVGGDPRTIQAGSTVNTGDPTLGNLVVRGTVHYVQGRYVWTEYFLADGTAVDMGDTRHRWLSVEDDEDNPGTLKVDLWTAVANPGVVPGARTITFQDVVYTHKEHGRARYTATQTTDLPPSGTYEFHDYEGPDGKSLSFERFNGEEDWEISIGDRVDNSLLSVSN